MNIPHNFVKPLTLLEAFVGIKTSEELYFSCSQHQLQPLRFFCEILHKIFVFAQTFDDGTPESRSLVWEQLNAMMGGNLRDAKSGRLFMPFLSAYLNEPEISLHTIELIYVAFIVTTSRNSESNLRSKLPENRANGPFSPWGCTLPASLYQLLLLRHWESRLEKLSSAHKRAIWNTCKSIPNFKFYNEHSIKTTIMEWAKNPLPNATSITIFFGAIGYLKENGVLKCDFCFPKTTIPVYSARHEEIVSSPISSPVTSPMLPSRSPSPLLEEQNVTFIPTAFNAIENHKRKATEETYGNLYLLASFALEDDQPEQPFKARRCDPNKLCGEEALEGRTREMMRINRLLC